MNDSAENKDPILEVAWTRYAEFDAASKKRIKTQTSFFRWASIVGVLAVLFAILSEIYPANLIPALIYAIKIVFVILPIAASLLANIGNQFFPGSDGLVLRAGAEQIHREIYQYRTILQGNAERKNWLENRLREILREIHRSLNGEMALEPYKGELPPPYSIGNERKDKGFADLSADEYYHLRTKDQLEWHISRRNRLSGERVRLQIYILLAGVFGSFFAYLGAFEIIAGIGLWVALLTSISTALISWKELRNLDMTIRNYSKVTLELGFVSDHWKNLTQDERTQAEFFNMVKDTESVLWNQNIEYIKSMQEALETSKQTQSNLIEQAIRQTQQAVSRMGTETMVTSVTITTEQVSLPEQSYQGLMGAPDFNPMSSTLVPEGTFDNPLENLRDGMAELVPEGSFDESPSQMSEARVPEGSYEPDNSAPPTRGVGD
ncbi:MAG: SLATT domain-containing protein [Anaerolineales bacterium]|nr:SLATT domain-containing protein [Anaerolineales bacterium]